MPNPIHHLHKRKRIHQKKEKYPSENLFKNYLDKIVYVIGVLGPISGSFQAIKIWQDKVAEGISLIMFGSCAIFNLIWISYGIVHKEKPIILMYCLWFIINTSVVIGTIIYS